MPGDAHPAGAGELRRLTQVGLDRFALFVADWPPSDVRMLTALLDKLRNSIAAVAAQEQDSARPGGAGQARPDRSSGTGYLPPNGGSPGAQARRGRTPGRVRHQRS